MAAAATGHLLIEDSESYVKQSYRNRCRIYACDGILSLTVPVSAPDGDRGIKSVRIDYSKPWLQQHERALVSAYRTSAFFEYYQDDVFAKSSCWNCWDSGAVSPSPENMSRSMVRMSWTCGKPYILKKQSRRCSGTASSLTIRCFLKNSDSYPDCRHWTCSSMRDRMPCPFSRISSPASEVSSSRGISHW